MRKCLFWTAIIGLIVSLLVHLSTFLLSNTLPSAFYVLHVVVFVLFAPAVHILKKSKISYDNFTDIFFTGRAKRFASLTIFFFIYAFINFIEFFILMKGLSPGIINNQFVLQDHGRIVETLTQAQYNKYLLYEFRGFSGHWMFFYSFSAIVFSTGIEK